MIFRRTQGFTLPEVMMAMGVGSMLMLSAAQVYPLMRQRSQSLGRHYQLDQLLRQTSFTIEKDLRRAGFCMACVTVKPSFSAMRQEKLQAPVLSRFMI